MSTLIENIGKDSVTDMTYLMYDDTLGAGLYAGVGCKNSMKKINIHLFSIPSHQFM